MSPIIIAILTLGGIGILSAIILFIVSKRFYVKEDPRIEQIEGLLPGANCGSCGRSGCHDFACACASADSLDNLMCPGAGDEAMGKSLKSSVLPLRLPSRWSLCSVATGHVRIDLQLQITTDPNRVLS